MLNNNLVLSFLISLMSTIFIKITNKKLENINNEITKKEILKIFGIIFIVCNIFFFLKKNNLNGGARPINMPSGESLLTHSSRPPF